MHSLCHRCNGYADLEMGKSKRDKDIKPWCIECLELCHPKAYRSYVEYQEDELALSFMRACYGLHIDATMH
jgi:hypothetical protein